MYHSDPKALKIVCSVAFVLIEFPRLVVTSREVDFSVIYIHVDCIFIKEQASNVGHWRVQELRLLSKFSLSFVT